MSQVTPPSSWALLLYACAERTSPFYPYSFSCLLLAAEMPPDAGHGSVNLHLRLFPAVMSSLSSNRLAMLLPNRHGRQDRLKTCTVGRKLATASHARMTMTVAGLLSRRQESGAFPLSVAPPFELPRGALRHPLCFPFSFPPLQQVCRYSHAAIPDGISGAFSLQGQR